MSEDQEGKAEEVEGKRKRTEEEGIKSGKSEVVKKMEKVTEDCKRACLNFCGM